MGTSSRLHLHEKPSRFAALMAAAVDAIIVIDSRGLIQEFNPAAERLFGYSQDEVMGANVSILMPAPYSAEHDHYLARYNATGEARIIGIGREVVARRKDGTTFPIDLSVGEVLEGETGFFVGILRDISDRKAAEEALRQREEALRQVVENAPSGILTCDRSGRISAVNRTLCRILGCGNDAVEGRMLADILHPYALGEVRTATDQLFGGHGGSFSLDVRLLREDGLEVPCRLVAGIVHDASAQPYQMILQLEDLSEQLAARQEAQQHRERLTHVTRLSTLGEMAAGIAHEINQPLTAIATYAQAARRLQERGATRDLDSALEKVAQQAERAASVIKRLRAFVKQQESEQTLLDANNLVVEVIQFVQMDSGRREIPIVPELAPELPKVLADNVQIQQVLLNLILNAMDATIEADVDLEVQIRTYAADTETVVFEVSDRGCGVSEAGQSQLFTPFFTTKSSGLGMGLPICRSIINAHGGQLNYHPNPVGGSIFRFTLPSIPDA